MSRADEFLMEEAFNDVRYLQIALPLVAAGYAIEARELAAAVAMRGIQDRELGLYEAARAYGIPADELTSRLARSPCPSI